jgi:hypothetical protein
VLRALHRQLCTCQRRFGRSTVGLTCRRVNMLLICCCRLHCWFTWPTSAALCPPVQL